MSSTSFSEGNRKTDSYSKSTSNFDVDSESTSNSNYTSSPDHASPINVSYNYSTTTSSISYFFLPQPGEPGHFYNFSSN